MVKKKKNSFISKRRWLVLEEPSTAPVSIMVEINHGFLYAYGWNANYEKLLGMWTIKNEDSILKRRVWILFFLMIICIWIPQMSALIIVWGDMNAMIECLATNLSFSIAILKITVLQYQRKVISSTLTKINDDWTRVSKKEELDAMIEFGGTSRFISLVSFGLTNMVILEYMALKIWNIATNTRNVNIDPRLTDDFLFVVYYPFDTTGSYVFINVWLGQFFATIAGGMCYAAPDCLISMLVLHVCGQLRIIRNSFENVVNEAKFQESGIYWKKMAAVVRKHQRLNELAISIKRTFSLILLVQMVACSIVFCLQSFLIFTTLIDRNGVPIPILELGFSIIYAIYTLTHLFIYCYVGDKLFMESTNVANNFYKANWYDLPSKEAKAFLHVCQRSKIPLEITAGKFCTFNLQLFNAVLKNSMGYLSMLIAMKERLVD